MPKLKITELQILNPFSIVNGLVKTALGVPQGTATSLSPAQDQTFRIESVKCLATVIKSMGLWMDQQLKIGDFTPKSTEITDGAHSVDSFGSFSVEEGSGSDFDSNISDSGSEVSDASTLEQRRVYKLELQVRNFLNLIMYKKTEMN